MSAAVRLRSSTVIDAPVDAVWNTLRDFNGHDRWHPEVAESGIEGGDPADMVGAVRRFRLRGGAVLREQLLALSDGERSFSYCLLEAPFPLMGYVAHVRLRPVTDGDRTFWEWSSTFHAPPGRRTELRKLVEDDIYRAGFAAVRRLFAGSPRPATPSAVPASARGPEPTTSPAPVASARPPSSSEAATRAIVVERHGGPEVMALREVVLPRPGRGEVQLRHSAIGVNFVDVHARDGTFDLIKLPGVPGMEAAGVVEAVGEGVADLRPGDRVAYACAPVGAYAERRTMAGDMLVKLGPDIPDRLAAASLLKGVTASFLLHDVHRLRAGETALVHAAAGGVGQILVQWARHLGASVIATVSSEDKAEFVRSLGAHHVIVHAREDFAEAVLRLTGGRGADVAYDAVGRDTFASTLRALGARGHLVSFGQASGHLGQQDIGRLSSKSITLSRPNYGHYTDTPERLQPHVSRFFAALRQGFVRLPEPTAYPLAQAAEAHRDLEGRRTTGSLVLIP